VSYKRRKSEKERGHLVLRTFASGKEKKAYRSLKKGRGLVEKRKKKGEKSGTHSMLILRARWASRKGKGSMGRGRMQGQLY